MVNRRSGHQLQPRLDQTGPIIGEGQGYPVNIPKTSLGAAFAEAFVKKRREQEKELMLRREIGIDKGLIHESWALMNIRQQEAKKKRSKA